MFLSVPEREVRPRDGTDGEELQAVATERKDAQCPGGMG